MSFSLNDVALLLSDLGICVLVLALACYTSTIRQIAGVFAYDLQHSAWISEQIKIIAILEDFSFLKGWYL